MYSVKMTGRTASGGKSRIVLKQNKWDWSDCIFLLLKTAGNTSVPSSNCKVTCQYWRSVNHNASLCDEISEPCKNKKHDGYYIHIQRSNRQKWWIWTDASSFCWDPLAPLLLPHCSWIVATLLFSELAIGNFPRQRTSVWNDECRSSKFLECCDKSVRVFMAKLLPALYLGDGNLILQFLPPRIFLFTFLSFQHFFFV